MAMFRAAVEELFRRAVSGGAVHASASAVAHALGWPLSGGAGEQSAIEMLADFSIREGYGETSTPPHNAAVVPTVPGDSGVCCGALVLCAALVGQLKGAEAARVVTVRADIYEVSYSSAHHA